MVACPKNPPVKDRKYLDYLRTQPCLFTGQYSTDSDAVDPAHVGTYGKGMKTDDEAISCLHSIHQSGHNGGEITAFHKVTPNWLFREMLRAYAREQYQAWKARQ